MTFGTWMKLCEEAAEKKDFAELIKLLEEINEQLDTGFAFRSQKRSTSKKIRNAR